MTQQTVVQLVDDLDGTSGDDIEAVTFALDGVTYEIDLAQNNAAQLRNSIATFINATTRTGGRLKRGLGASTETGDHDKEQTRAIREWAHDNGHQVADRGRIPAMVIAAYQASITKTKPAPSASSWGDLTRMAWT
jgi:hypothetical protein